MSSTDNKTAALLVAKLTDNQRFEEQRQEIAETLDELVADIRFVQGQLRQGEVERKAETGKLLSYLRYWLKAVRETEAELENIRRKELGLEGAWGLDLDPARSAAWCRLPRLRACRGAGALSE